MPQPGKPTRSAAPARQAGSRVVSGGYLPPLLPLLPLTDGSEVRIDQHGQVIDVMLSARRDLAAARRFFATALTVGVRPTEVTTDRAPAYPRVLDEQAHGTLHVIERFANSPIEADHSQLKDRLRPMRGLQRLRSAQTVSAGHAFVQTLRRGQYETATEEPAHDRVRIAFDQLAQAV